MDIGHRVKKEKKLSYRKTGILMKINNLSPIVRHSSIQISYTFTCFVAHSNKVVFFFSIMKIKNTARLFITQGDANNSQACLRLLSQEFFPVPPPNIASKTYIMSETFYRNIMIPGKNQFSSSTSRGIRSCWLAIQVADNSIFNPGNEKQCPLASPNITSTLHNFAPSTRGKISPLNKLTTIVMRSTTS